MNNVHTLVDANALQTQAKNANISVFLGRKIYHSGYKQFSDPFFHDSLLAASQKKQRNNFFSDNELTLISK